MKFYFASPGMLALLAALPVAFVLMRRGVGLRELALRKFGIVKASDWWRRAAVLCSVLCVVLALARPTFETSDRGTSPRTGDVLFLLDVSRSMLSNDAQPSRLEHAKKVILRLANLVPNDRVGLVAFAGTQSIECPLTEDVPFFEEAVNLAGPAAVARGGTRIGDAIRFAVQSGFDDVARSERQLVILTDGGDQESLPEVAAVEASKRGIQITVIGVGSATEDSVVPASETDPTPVSYHGAIVRTRMEATALRRLAMAGGGQYQNAGQARIVARRTAIPTAGVDRRFILVLATLALVLLLWEGFIFRPASRQSIATCLIATLVLNAVSPIQAAESAEEWAAKGLEIFRGLDYKGAIVPYENAVRLSHGKPEMVFNLACAHYMSGNYDQALKAFTKVATTAEKGSRLEARARLGMGDTLYWQSTLGVPVSPRWYGEEPHRGANLRLNPMASGAAEFMLRSALQEYRSALKIRPDLKDVVFNIGVVERRLTALRDEDTSGKVDAAERDPSSVVRRGKLAGGAGFTPTRQPVERDW